MAGDDWMSEFGNGVCFRKDDYGSFPRRLLATIVDVFVLVVCFVGVVSVWDVIYEGQSGRSDGSDIKVLLVVMLVLTWFYLGILKASSVRTVGYRLAGLRIVTLKGRRVPWYQMTYRLLIWVCGPFNFVFDACWLFADEARQSFRDCYAGTLVVRNDAVPEAEAPIQLTRYGAMGFNLVYKRAVRPSDPQIAATAEKDVK